MNAMKFCLIQLLIHPITQVCTYSCIVVGSIYFYSPLIIMHGISAYYFQWFGIIGILGIITSLISCINKYSRFHIIGLVMMSIALMPYLAFQINGIPQVALKKPLSIFLEILFFIQSILVLIREIIRRYREM